MIATPARITTAAITVRAPIGSRAIAQPRNTATIGLTYAYVAAGVRMYASGMSSKARGLAEAALEGKPVELAMPNRLVQLVVESDRVLTY